MYGKNARNKIIFTIASVGLGLLLIAPAYFTPQQAYTACTTYDSSNNRIVVSCNSTLPQVATEINNPSIIEDKGNGEYIIRATLQASHAKLTISSTDGVSWLKITKNYGLYYYYASGLISGVKITSWDENTSSVIDNAGAASRAWIRFYRTTDATIQNSELAYLGHGTEAASARGISFEGSGSTNVHIDNVEFHHDHYAFYSSYLTNSDLKNSNFHNNDKYDIDPHTNTNNFVIANNHVHDSQAQIGIICSYNCYSITIEGNTVEGSTSSGITFSRNMHDSVVRNNIIFNTPTAISVGNSPNNEIYGNTIHDVSRGIYFSTSSTEGIAQNNLAHDNTISKATYALISSSAPVNTVKHNFIDSGTVSYEYYLTANSKFVIDTQSFNFDKIRGVTGSNPVQIQNSDNISIDGGAPVDTNAAPYSTTLSGKIITVNTVSGTAPPPDIIRPSVKITSPANGATLPGNSTIHVTGTASDTDSGVKTVQVHVDTGTYQTAVPNAPGDWTTWSIDLSITTPGTHKIQARATDNAGNQNWYSISVTIT